MYIWKLLDLNLDIWSDDMMKFQQTYIKIWSFMWLKGVILIKI
jgi:hypothetical protein